MRRRAILEHTQKERHASVRCLKRNRRNDNQQEPQKASRNKKPQRCHKESPRGNSALGAHLELGVGDELGGGGIVVRGLLQPVEAEIAVGAARVGLAQVRVELDRCVAVVDGLRRRARGVREERARARARARAKGKAEK